MTATLPAHRPGCDPLTYGLEVNAWCAQNFPGVQPRDVVRHGEALRTEGVEPTVETLRPLVQRSSSKEAA
jgi:hypothetical protein